MGFNIEGGVGGKQSLNLRCGGWFANVVREPVRERQLGTARFAKVMHEHSGRGRSLRTAGFANATAPLREPHPRFVRCGPHSRAGSRTSSVTRKPSGSKATRESFVCERNVRTAGFENVIREPLGLRTRFANRRFANFMREPVRGRHSRAGSRAHLRAARLPDVCCCRGRVFLFA